jgi:hypothetical protein
MNSAPAAILNPTSDWLAILTGYVLLGFIALIGILVIWKIFNGTIDLSMLISEPNGDASMSRFQLLIFTFVIAASLFLIIVSERRFPPTIPQGILVLLGISSSSYLVSKGIQFSQPQQDVTIAVVPKSVTVPAVVVTSPPTAQAPIAFHADTSNLDNKDNLAWQLDPPGIGTIDKKTGAVTNYTPPDPASWPPAGQVVKLSLSTSEDANATDVAIIQF